MSFNHHTTSSEMETEQDPFSFTDLNQMPTESCRPLQINNLPDVMISSWLEMENMYGPTMPNDDALQHLRLLGDDHSFQLDTTTHHPSSSSSSFLPQNHHSYSTESFLLDLCDFDTTPAADTDAYCPILPELSAIVAPKAAAATEEEEEDEADRFLDDNDLYLITPAESHESCADQLHAQMSTATNISAAANNTTTATEDACPRKSKARKEVAARNKEEEEEEEADEVGTDEDPKPGTLNCKNLVSERNRRKRLSQQLLALRALVPNITKMDKRSVLVDALAYLKSIREETERLQRELKESSSASRTNYEDDRSLVPSHSLPARLSNSKTKAQILEIDAEKIEERRFVIKITCKGGGGIGGEVLRVIESLGLEITYVALEQIKPLHVLTTVFVRVRKQGRMTEEKLRDSIISTALRSGITLQDP